MSSIRKSTNVKSVLRLDRNGFICARVKHAAEHDAATHPQTGMPASTRALHLIRSSRPPNPASGGSTVFPMMRLPNTDAVAGAKAFGVLCRQNLNTNEYRSARI